MSSGGIFWEFSWNHTSAQYRQSEINAKENQLSPIDGTGWTMISAEFRNKLASEMHGLTGVGYFLSVKMVYSSLEPQSVRVSDPFLMKRRWLIRKDGGNSSVV